MDKKRLLGLAGSMQQLAYVRPVTFGEGKAGGMKAFSVKNGPLQFTVAADKCLDIAEVQFCGHNMNFLAKPGLMGRSLDDFNGAEAVRSIMGGMLFTCGLRNICAPCYMEGREHPMHGRMRTAPAEHVGADACWAGDDYVLSISGEMREAELFGENLLLRRKITTRFGENSIYIEDQIINEGFRTEPMMLLYHINAGYPFLSEEAEIVLPTKKVVPRDEAASPHTGNFHRMEPPKAGEPEYVFLHEMAADKRGNTFGAIINPGLGIGLKLDYNVRELPYFMQWKSIAAGDYVVGLEPANASVYGRAYHREKGDLHRMEPFSEEVKRLKLTFLTGAELDGVKKEAEDLLKEEGENQDETVKN